MKKWICGLLTAALALSAAGVLAEEGGQTPIGISISGPGQADTQRLAPDPPPIMERDRVLVPVRSLCEALGAEVSWNDSDETVNIGRGGDYIRLKIGDETMYVGKYVMSSYGAPVILDVPPRLVGDRTFIPLRALCEALSCDVEWLESEQLVQITDHGPIELAPASPEPSSSASPDRKPSETAGSLEARLQAAMPADANYMISPFSIKMALAMAANGAEGETRQQILDTAGIEDLEQYNESVKKLMNGYSGLDEVNVIAANSIWLNTDYFKDADCQFAPEFKNVITGDYSGEAGTVTGQDAVQTVNDWISEQTQDKVKDVLVDSSFAAALVNTLYMQAPWLSPFLEEETERGEFTQRNGQTAEIDLMHQTDRFQYYEDDRLQAVRLPYAKKLCMYVVLPKGSAAPSEFLGQAEKMESRKVALTLPKFRTEYKMDLKPVLEDMGMQKAFAGSAEFSQMLVGNPLPVLIDRVLHKTFIEVDENGTEAAAATVVGMVGSAMPKPEEIVEFTADRPFAYYICDNETGEVLFLGEYAYVK